jgi:hypothetical protein
MMNRTQAIERVDEILGLFAEMYVSGRCPRCEVLLYDADDRRLPPGTVATRRLVHEGSCEVGHCTQELARLSRRFGIPLEPVLLIPQGTDRWVLAVRRAAEGTDGPGPVVVPTDSGQESSLDVS